MHDQERHHLFVVHRAARKRFESTAMERRFLLLLFVAFAVGVAEGRWKKGKRSECINEFSGTEGVITNADLTTDATCKVVLIKIDAGEPVTFSCSKFNFTSGNNSYCMIVSTKGKGGKRGNGKGGNNKDDDPGRPRRGRRSVGDGTDEETAQGLLANALLRGPLSQHFLNREKRHRNLFGGESMENGKESMESHGRRRGRRNRGRGKKGQKFCDDAPTNVEISKGTAKIMLVPNRRRKDRGADSTPVLDVVAFECSWEAN
ncbi:uncharacterized protein LOC134775035 [Penaeus indicus]|uniref:uncharacterized protein LOC134775035 n=1 Tax=Penaeus indicus TaxID=29960 RepID=UPI00300C8B54